MMATPQRRDVRVFNRPASRPSEAPAWRVRRRAGRRRPTSRRSAAKPSRRPGTGGRDSSGSGCTRRRHRSSDACRRLPGRDPMPCEPGRHQDSPWSFDRALTSHGETDVSRALARIGGITGGAAMKLSRRHGATGHGVRPAGTAASAFALTPATIPLRCCSPSCLSYRVQGICLLAGTAPHG